MTITANLAPARRGRPLTQDTDRHIAAMLRARRIALGLTQQQLAGVLGITYQQAHKYETGANRISVGRLYMLAQALGVEPGYFFEGLETGERPQHLPHPRQMLELTRSFAALPRHQQEALGELARAIAGVEADGEAQEEAALDAA